jgi:hypothetical protein
VNDGVFSLLKGLRQTYSRPRLISFARRPTTDDTETRVRISSRNCGGKAICAQYTNVALAFIARAQGCETASCGYRNWPFEYPILSPWVLGTSPRTTVELLIPVFLRETA